MNDVPKHLGGTTHSIITEDKQMNIPLELRGIISHFPVQTPTDHELDHCPSIILTSEYEWNPYSEDFEDEEKRHKYKNKIAMVKARNQDDIVLKRVIAVQSQLQTKSKGLFLTHEELSKRWAISPAVARQTLTASTQTFVRNTQGPVERRYKTKNLMLKYNRINCRLYSDTFFAHVTSL